MKEGHGILLGAAPHHFGTRPWSKSLSAVM